ncbi:nuclear distribution protein nudE homolog 1-like isoform X2 [Gigantopelta aegis]|uniref:nuclear distribution protein nudE homolog 1-like isoform X2 n=1 Tax=Gigantopelta aegis TaxID=1735272 RepID=UPI001B88CC26|nr:nuclear distribution protein nudE homolog 1-like isoform X2 [Gigantopelta aegis]XP_041364474.1 nuclear distribution protein nudE homolog 1-like isoform X2 [Gigantopelta aegis]
MADDSKKFQTPSEEIAYLRKQSQQFKQELEETKEELEEFQISSHELENELETQLEQCDSKNKELIADKAKLEHECAALREKLEKLQRKSHSQISMLEDELAEVTAYKDKLERYVRELEQMNDDLERAKRATVSSLEDFESRLNQAIERNAFLESELDEKETLSETVQRLKDEARDLRQELEVKEKTHSEQGACAEGKDKRHSLRMLDSGYDGEKMATTPSTPTTPTTPLNRGLSSTGSNTPFTPSARISALNIVGDLLRKVGEIQAYSSRVKASFMSKYCKRSASQW